MTRKSYILQNMDDEFWRQVKSKSALEGLTIQDYIINLIKKDLKIKQKPTLNKRKK